MPEKVYPVDRESDEQPHHVSGDEDHNSYWIQFVTCKNGDTTCGTGTSPEQAIREAGRNRKFWEDFVSQDPKVIIQSLINRPNGCRGTQEQNDFNFATAKLLGISTKH